MNFLFFNKLAILLLLLGYSAFAQVRPISFEAQIISVEDRVDSGESETKESLTLAKLISSFSAIQQNGRHTTYQVFAVDGGQAFSDRQFANLTSGFNLNSQYTRSSFNLSLGGNWGKGQDFSQSLQIQDLFGIDDPNTFTFRYLYLSPSYTYIISALTKST